jgi:hypothetical protein
MTYLDLINQFWQKDLEYSFSSTEVDVYFRLLDRCNKLGWKSPFNLSVERLMAQMGMRTKKPLDTARKRLREAGLLEFKNGSGRGLTTEYTLIGVGTSFERVPERGNKNIPLSGTLSEPLSGALSGLLHKSKIKSKKKESNDSESADKISASTTVEEPPLAPWAAWITANAPDVQRMKQPLTAEQWTQLVKDFGEPTTCEVLLAMHNTTGAEKKYKSAYLTARAWCGRRQPQRPTHPTPIQAAGATESLEPELNTNVVAEREARREADLQASRRRLRENQTAAIPS